MDKPNLAEVTDLVQRVLEANMNDANGIERFNSVHYSDGLLVAGCTKYDGRISWIAEVSLLVNHSPVEIGPVTFSSSGDGGHTWTKRRGGAPNSLKAQAEMMREHVIAIRDSGRFATREQGCEAIYSLKELLAAFETGDLDMIEAGIERAQALLGSLMPDVNSPADGRLMR